MQPHHIQQAIDRLHTDNLRVPKSFGAEDRREIKWIRNRLKLAGGRLTKKEIRWLREQYLTRYDEHLPGDSQ